MTDLDQLIRQSFADEAAEAPDGADLLHRVRHRDRQLTTRRRITFACLAAAVTVTAVPGYLLATRTPHDAHHGTTGTPAPGSTKPPTLRLTPAHVPVVSMPVYAGWLPATPLEAFVNPYALLTYTFGDESIPDVNIVLSPQDPLAGQDGGLVREPAAVAGVPATFTHAPGDGQPLSLTWERTPGRWVQVEWLPRIPAGAARASTDRATLTRIAENLRDQETPVSAPFRFRWLPEQARPALTTPNQMYFHLPSGSLVVDVQAGRPIPAGLTPATAGRWHGWIGLRDTGDALGGIDRWQTAFYVQLDHDRTLMISGPRSELDQLDILGIAAGLSLNTASR